jgi:putative iron-dependent peroxidase
MVNDGGAGAVRRVLAGFPAMTAAIAAEAGEPRLAAAAAIGAAAWPVLCGPRMPRGLVPFAPLAEGNRRAPATPGDLFVHIHSPRHDANFLLARRLVEGLGGAARVVEEVHGFRHMGGRDLTGFADGSENPEGDERAAVALAGAEDPDFAGGSFVSVQRWVHDLTRWQALAVPEQEATIGRTKADDQELPDETKPATAHIARVVIEEDGEELEILRHSMPYGTTAESGLYFVAYCRSPDPFRHMLERMVTGEGDRLMDFTRPVTGAAFFAPSTDFLHALATDFRP